MNSKDIVTRAVKKDDLTHAYLAPVRSGTDLKSYAAELGQIILCPPDDKDCRGKVIRDTHPDFIRVNVLNDNSKISINQVEEIISSSSYSPVEGRKKLYVINRAEDLSTEAANSLLKILEDPPDFVYFLLLTESPNSLLPTIISRCQQLPRGGTSLEGMKSLLSSKGFDEKEIGYLVDAVNRKAALLDELLEEGFQSPLERKRTYEEEYRDLGLVELSEGLVEGNNFIERDVLAGFIFNSLKMANRFQLIGSAGELTNLSQGGLEWFLEKGLNIYRHDCRESINEGTRQCSDGRESLQKVRIMDRALESLSSNVNIQLLLESIWLRLANISAGFNRKPGV